MKRVEKRSLGRGINNQAQSSARVYICLLMFDHRRRLVASSELSNISSIHEFSQRPSAHLSLGHPFKSMRISHTMSTNPVIMPHIVSGHPIIAVWVLANMYYECQVVEVCQHSL